MSSLKYSEKSLLEKILEMKTGYVSDFSDRTLQEFVLDVTGLDILTEKYEKNGTSKANRIRTFWSEESDEVNADLIEALLKHAEFEKTQYDMDLNMSEMRLFGDARKIVQRLRDEPETSASPIIPKTAAGVFIAARKIENNGRISGPRVDVMTDDYSGIGSISADKVSDKAKKVHPIERLTNNQTIAIILGGLILLLVLYAVYRLSGINLSQFR